MAQTNRGVPAEELLRPYTLAALGALAVTRGVDPAIRPKGRLLKAVAAALYDAGSVAAALAALEPAEREVLDRVILLGGEVLTASLRHQLGAEGSIDAPQAGSAAAAGGKNRFQDIVARLAQRGLLFGANVGPYRRHVELGGVGQYLFIPHGVMRHLPTPTYPVETAPPPAVERLAHRADLLRDLYLLLATLRDEPIPLSARGQIPKRQLVRLDGMMRQPEGAAQVRSEGDLGRLPLLRALSEDLQLMVQGARGLTSGDDVPAFLQQAPGLRQRRLYDAYVRTRRWSELSLIREIGISPRSGLAGPKIVAARKVVLDEIGGLPADAWIPIAHVAARIRRRAFEFLIQRNWQYSHYYYGNSYYSDPEPYAGSNSLGLTFTPRNAQQAVSWDVVEGGFIRGAVQALHWLGVLDLGTSGDGAPTVLRVTEAGTTLLQGGVPASTSSRPNVVVQPNFQVLAFEPTGEDVLYTLDRIAERVRAEQVVEYYLTRTAIYAAQRAGKDIGEVIAFLERVGSTPLPQNVRRTLEEWGAGHQRVVVRPGLGALQTDAPETLDRLLQDEELAALLGRRLGPTVVLAPPAQLEQVRQRLLARASHPLPVLTEGDDARQGACLRIDADGRVVFVHAVPSVYVRAALRPFVDEEADGSLWLTPGSLRRAVQAAHDRTSGTADGIIDTLERLHAGPLPEEVRALVRQWARDWGRGTIAQVAMLEVESAEIMAELLNDAELGAQLEAVPGNPALAAIAPGAVSTVRDRLRERGMELMDAPRPAAADGPKQ